MSALLRSVLLALAFATTAVVVGDASATDDDTGLIRGWIAAANVPGPVRRAWSEVAPELERIYEAGAPVWFASRHPSAQPARAGLALLADAGSQGLEPERYAAGRLSEELAILEAMDDPAAGRLEAFDVALSVAVLEYLADVGQGRVAARDVDMDFAPRRVPGQLGERIARALADDDVARLAEHLAPRLAAYQRLRAALPRYRALAAAAPPPPVVVAETVRPDQALTAADALAANLIFWGDLDAGARVTPSLEGELLAALRRFQRRHGLDVDGVLGPATAAALSVTPLHRLQQIEWAMERLRWLPPVDGRTAILVNVAAFELEALVAAEETERRTPMRSRIVVGRAGKTPTPMFTEALRYVVLRPYWNVPDSITTGELAPEILADPTYLDRNDYELVAMFRDDADVVAPDPEALARLAAGALQVRQRPGPANALGLVKFLLPNAYDVYLHDTPSKHLFGRARRDFSHGCIRVADPVDLATFALALQQDQPWPRERIAAAMREGENARWVALARPIPVIVFYATAAADDDGTMRFFEDIYDHDSRLAVALAEATQ